MFLDLSNVEEQKGFEVVPQGDYLVIVDDAQVKDTKSGTGAYINVKFLITEGEYKNRAIFNMFNIKNDNQQAVKIGLEQLKAFLKISGYKTPESIESVTDLIGLTATAVVKNKKDDYGDKAYISYFKPVLAAKSGSQLAAQSDVPF